MNPNNPTPDPPPTLADWQACYSQLVAVRDALLAVQHPLGESHELNLIEDALSLEISNAARECERFDVGCEEAA